MVVLLCLIGAFILPVVTAIVAKLLVPRIAREPGSAIADALGTKTVLAAGFALGLVVAALVSEVWSLAGEKHEVTVKDVTVSAGAASCTFDWPNSTAPSPQKVDCPIGETTPSRGDRLTAQRLPGTDYVVVLGSGLNPFAQMTLGCAGTFGLGAAIGAGLNLRPEQRRRRLFDRQIKREVERRGQQPAPHYSPTTTRSTSTTPQQHASWPAQWNGVTTWTWQQIAEAADRSPLTPDMWQAAHDAMASNAYAAAPVTSSVPLEYPLQFVRLAVTDPAAAGRCVCVVFGADTSWLLQADGSPAVSGFARMKQNPAQARDLRMTVDGVDHDVADAPEALTAQQAELLREALSRIVAAHGAR